MSDFFRSAQQKMNGRTPGSDLQQIVRSNRESAAAAMPPPANLREELTCGIAGNNGEQSFQATADWQVLGQSRHSFRASKTAALNYTPAIAYLQYGG
jgi:hypothetical protein